MCEVDTWLDLTLHTRKPTKSHMGVESGCPKTNTLTLGFNRAITGINPHISTY